MSFFKKMLGIAANHASHKVLSIDADRVIEQFTGFSTLTLPSGVVKVLDSMLAEWEERIRRSSGVGLRIEDAAVLRLIALLETGGPQVHSWNAGLHKLVLERKISPEIFMFALKMGWPKKTP